MSRNSRGITSTKANSSFNSSSQTSQDIDQEIATLTFEAENLVGKDNVRAQQLIEKTQKLIQETNSNASNILRISSYLNHYICNYSKSVQQAVSAIQILRQYLKTQSQDQKYQNQSHEKGDQKQREIKQDLSSEGGDQIKLKEYEADILFLLADSLFYLDKIGAAEAVFKNLLQKKVKLTELFSIEQVKKKLDVIQLIYNNSTQTNARTEEKKRECLQEVEQFKKKLKECEDNGYMNEHGLPVYLISTHWFNKWQNYVGWNEDKSEKTQKGSFKLGFPEFDVKEISYEYEHPGEIECGDILEQYPKTTIKLGIDPDKVKAFCNLVLKRDLQETQHFIILPVPVGDILIKKYGGIRVKRLILSLQEDSNLTQVEVRPQCIQFVVVGSVRNLDDSNQNVSSYSQMRNSHVNSASKINSDSMNEELKNMNQIENKIQKGLQNFCSIQIIKAYISKKETIISLKQKLIRIIIKQLISNNFTNYLSQNMSCKLWRGDESLNLKSLVRAYEKRQSSQVYINAKLIDSTFIPLDEAEIAEEDIIVVEISGDGKDFFLQNESELLVARICGNCGAKYKKLCYCECMLIMYCDAKCQKDHRKKHKGICQQTKSELKNKKEMLDKLKIKVDRKQSTKSVHGLCGLKNLGNTCFMNSSLQCLSNVQDLTQFMLQNKFLHDLNRQNPLGTGGYLAAAYAELIKDMWTGSERQASPWNLKKTIGKFAPQFNGYNQQDSHELLSYLLDGIHEDLNRVKTKPLVNQIESDGKNDLEAALRSWDNYQKRNKSAIIDLFVGQFKSILNCPECKQISVTFDPYMTISLPIPSKQIIQQTVYVNLRNSKNLQEWKVSLQKSDTLAELKEKVRQQLKLDDINELKVCLQNFGKDFQSTTLQDNVKIEQIQMIKDSFLFIFQIYSPLDIDKDVPKNKDEQILVKLQIKGWNKNEKQFTSQSYSRVFTIGGNTSYKLIHLKAWQVLRVCLQGVSEQEQQIEQLKEEFEEVLEKYGEGDRYQLFLEDKFLVDYSEDKTLANQFSTISTQKTQVEIRLTLLQNIFDKLQMNTCEEQVCTIKSANQGNAYNLYDCLNLFVQKEVLEKGNEWYCSKCKNHVQATKQLHIFNTPKVLIIHLKRFKQTKYGNSMYFSSGGVKLDEYIDFPVNGLDLSQFTQLHQIEKQNNFKTPRNQKSDSMNNEDLKSTAESTPSKEKDLLLYDLFAVSNHYGTLAGGHYTAFAQNHKNGKWYHFNDSSVSEINESEIPTKAAYLLFYKRREKANSFNFEDTSSIRSSQKLYQSNQQ